MFATVKKCEQVKSPPSLYQGDKVADTHGHTLAVTDVHIHHQGPYECGKTHESITGPQFTIKFITKHIIY